MKNQALQSSIHDQPTALGIEMPWNLNHENAGRLGQEWRSGSSTIANRKLIVDMKSVTGAANSPVSRTPGETTIGEPSPEPPQDAIDSSIRTQTWLPRSVSLLARTVTLALLASVVCPVEAGAATLTAETLTAWGDYLQIANASAQDRLRPGGSFLWALEDAGRASRIRGGEIVVASAPGQSPRNVPGGLIHHWIGAVFVPNARLDDILAVTRAYDSYKEFYRPSVIESKLVARNGSNDQFSMLIMNKAFFLTSALDADYEAANVSLSDRRFYAISRTTRIQEVEEYGQPGEHRKPEGEGGGYIWKLYSIARLEQRDDGVYVELEVIALSRDIPAVLRFVVDPIVRRVSRNSLLISLQQTKAAVRGGTATVARSGGAPARAERPRGDSGTLSDGTSTIRSVR